MATIKWKVENALSRDVERQHLNKILKDIEDSVTALQSRSSDSSNVSNVKDTVGEMVEGNSESGINVTYNNVNKVLDFAVSSFILQLTGDVTGQTVMTPGGQSVMTVTIDPSKLGISDAPSNSFAYWRRAGVWEAVGNNLEQLQDFVGPGIIATSYDGATELTTLHARTLQTGDGIDILNPAGDTGDPTISFNADTAEVAHLPGATYKTVQKIIDVMFSPGIITGGEVTELTSTSVRITAGTAVVRIADDNVSELRFFDFPSQDFSVPDVQVTHFYALDYNGGSPIIVESTVTENWDRDTQIPLGSALRGDGLLNVTANPYRMGDIATNFIQRLDAVGPVQRDNSVGGLQIGETGTRNVTVSAGRLWARVSDFTVTSKNSATNTMASVYFNGTNLTVTSGLTQWDNLNFNNLGTGLLQVLGNNKYANLWFFMSFDGTKYGFAYGTNEYNTLGDAANESIPSYLTQNFFNQFILLGRFVFQKSAATASIIESAFVTPFSSAAINTHNNLGGLQGGTTGEYYHLTAAQQADVATLSTGGTAGQFWRGDQVYSNTLDGPFTANGNINITGTGRRVLAEMDGGSASSRLTFQDVNTNSISVFQIAPTGTAQFSAYAAFNSSDLENSSTFVSIADPTSIQFGSSTTGSGTLLPLVITMGGTDALRIDATAHALEAPRAIRETGVVSPPQLTADTNDWVVTGITASSVIRATTDASRNLTGIASPTAGQMIRLINVGSFDLVLVHDATSTAANRFLLPNSANLTLNPNDSVSLWYDNISSRWRALGV